MSKYNRYGKGWKNVDFEEKQVCRKYDDHVIVEIETKGHKYEMIVDYEGFEKLKLLKRKITVTSGYATVSISGKAKKLHRILTNAPDELVVDHINRNKLDNRLSNLRLVTKAENGQNQNIYGRKTKSGIRGVQWSRHANSWRVTMILNGEYNDFGHFKKLEDAKKVAIEARKKYMPYSPDKEVVI